MRLKDHPCLRPFCRSSTRTSSFELRDSCLTFSSRNSSRNFTLPRHQWWRNKRSRLGRAVLPEDFPTLDHWTISWFRAWSIDPQNDFSNSWDEAPIPNSVDFRTSRIQLPGLSRSTICPGWHSLFQVLQVSGSTSASCQRKDCLTGSTGATSLGDRRHGCVTEETAHTR